MTQYKAQIWKPFYCPWAQLQGMEVYSLVMCFPLICGKCDLQLWYDSCLKTLRKLLGRGMPPLVWVDPFVSQLWTKAMAIACQWACWCLRLLKPYCRVGLPFQICCCGNFNAPAYSSCGIPLSGMLIPRIWRQCPSLYLSCCYFHFPQVHLSIMI